MDSQLREFLEDIVKSNRKYLHDKKTSVLNFYNIKDENGDDIRVAVTIDIVC